MINKNLRRCLVLLALGVSWAAAEEPRPACNKNNVGQLWPNAANRDHVVLSKMARCGELEICTRGVWRYSWERLTVRLDQLRGGSKFRKPPACEVQPEQPADSGKTDVAAATGTK